MKGLELRVLEQKREEALGAVIDSCEADFQKMRVGLSGRTAAALARFLELEGLCAAAVDLRDERKATGKHAPARQGGTPSANEALDLEG